MKKLLFLTLIIWGSKVMAQPNPTSLAASVATEVPLAAWFWPAEPLMMDAAKDYAKEYRKRMLYYAPTVIDAGRVAIREVTGLQDRVRKLRRDNTALGPIYSHRKRLNQTRLNTIDALLAHLMREFDNLNNRVGIYGERLNLNENTRMSMKKLSRKLDVIESEIANTGLINRLFN